MQHSAAVDQCCVNERLQNLFRIRPYWLSTGIKIFSKTNLDQSRTKKAVGVELYRGGRYFTVTGHSINGHCALPGEVQDLGWFVQKHWGDNEN